MKTGLEIVASPEMRIFFENLLALKNHLKHHADTETIDRKYIYQDIFEKLDKIIKEGK